MRVETMINKRPILVITLLTFLLLVLVPMISYYLFSGIVVYEDLKAFNWEGVSGLTNIIMTIVTIVLLIGIWQAKESQEETKNARIQATNASDAEVLRWAMDEMTQRKNHIRLVTDAYKSELENILIPLGFKGEQKTHKYKKRIFKPSYSDQDRISFLKEISKSKKKEFYSKVEGIDGNDWSQDIKDALHKEVSIIMQRMGYMALFGLISKQHFINLWGPIFLASWYSIEWYIKDERKSLNENLDSEDSEKNLSAEKFIDKFGPRGNNRDYKGAFFRIHLETFIKECEAKLPLELVNNERLKFGRPLLKI